jgi:hypothetical protein
MFCGIPPRILWQRARTSSAHSILDGSLNPDGVPPPGSFLIELLILILLHSDPVASSRKSICDFIDGSVPGGGRRRKSKIAINRMEVRYFASRVIAVGSTQQ